MECPRCGRWAPPDPETGYDADELCPECKDMFADEHPDDWEDLLEDAEMHLNDEAVNPNSNAAVENPVPPGWMHAAEDVRAGGIVYTYPAGVLPDGQTEFHLTREALHKYIFPNRD